MGGQDVYPKAVKPITLLAYTTSQPKKQTLSFCSSEKLVRVNIYTFIKNAYETSNANVNTYSILGAFATLRKVIDFIVCPAVNPSARNNSAPTEIILMKFDV
jgi:hypothetical protein